jgi:hypothetical protein
MEPIAMITGALAAGAAVAVKETTSQAARDAYSGLKSLIRKRFREKKSPEGETALVKFEEKPQVWKDPLKDLLSETGAGKAEDILKAAELLEKILSASPEGRAALSRHIVTVQNSQVGVIGDHAVVHDISFGKKGD